MHLQGHDHAPQVGLIVEVVEHPLQKRGDARDSEKVRRLGRTWAAAMHASCTTFRTNRENDVPACLRIQNIVHSGHVVLLAHDARPHAT